MSTVPFQTMLQCRICLTVDSHPTYLAREMMFGLRDPFQYFECSRCGCVQIKEIPQELSRYYPASYYSFTPPRPSGVLKRFLHRQWLGYAKGGANPLGWLYTRLRGRLECARWLSGAGVGPHSAILDVGGGGGHLAAILSEMGFCNITVIDPYLDKETCYGNAVRILRRDMGNVEGTFDLIMFHHSFEHIADQDAALMQSADHLKPGGHILIRIPVAAFAWRKYRTNWVQLDAPRHFYLHTKQSMQILVNRHGLQIETTVDDSSAMQFWASEQYQHDIPLRDTHSYSRDKSHFTRQQVDEFTREAQKLNSEGQGDQTCFYIVKV